MPKSMRMQYGLLVVALLAVFFIFSSVNDSSVGYTIGGTPTSGPTGNPSPGSGHTPPGGTTTGTPGFPPGQGKECELEDGKVECKGPNGYARPYLCDDVFHVSSTSEDSHSDAICDVDSVHCPEAEADARKQAADFCKSKADCSALNITGTKKESFCVLKKILPDTWFENQWSETSCTFEVWAECIDLP